MVGLQPMILDNQRFTQRQAAKILEVHHTTIRNYEMIGLIAPGIPSRNRKYYYGKDIKRCWKKYFSQPI